MFTDSAKNEALDAITDAFVSAHDGFPGNAGNNEIAGGSYARQSITWAAAASGSKSSSNTPAIPIPAGGTVRWLGLWSLVSGGVFKGYSPNGAVPKEYTVDASADTILANAHGYSDNDKIVFYGGNVPGGLVEGTVYYVVTATTDNFQVEASIGGGAINLTDENNDGLMSVIVEEAFGSAGTFNVDSYQESFVN